MSLADYWKSTTDKNSLLKDVPALGQSRQNARCKRCRKPDARDCFVDRQPVTARADKRRTCDCECHYH